MEDLEKTIHWRNNLDFIRMTQGIRFPKSLEMEKDWYQRILTDISNKNVFFGIEDNETKSLVGVTQIYDIDYVSSNAKWGIILGEKATHGKGYSHEALKLLFNYAFNILNLKKLNCFVLKMNIACLVMLQKLGNINEEGVLARHFYFDGQYHDVVILALFKEDFFNEN
jgi:RimJ/RimL family protein N-acetyltransferase